jgi:competence ComEA-like helix-hairpin-helix protein
VGPGREGTEERGTVQAPPDEEADQGAREEEMAPPGEEGTGRAAETAQADPGDRINLNRATFEELREVGFSVTQATRVLTYRERQNGFESLDDLADVPGMERAFLGEVQGKLTV